ncbi:hypothetical protein CSA37_05850 [Candidatus Fermentibacteria bacterium]|nr:MAG: hypothetical protein CSA37_05850 [Candidatus Fermentibacteria bacterium]
MKLLRSFSETAILLLVAGTAAHAVQWPLQPVDQTHSIYHGYGNYHRPWTDTTHVNFHLNTHDLAEGNYSRTHWP